MLLDLIQLRNSKPNERNIKNNIFDPAILDSTVSIWLVDPTYTQQQISSESMPSAIAGIATFTEYYLKIKNKIKIFKYPEILNEALEKYSIPDIIGFSNYMWNCELSLALARRIKEFAPNTIIIMGGPNYPVEISEQQQFLQKHREIDFYVMGEGELAFANLVAELLKVDLKKNKLNKQIPSTHYISSSGEMILSDKIQRLQDLTEIPSPYLDGKLDEFFDGKLQPVIQTTRGCPFGCTFCVEGLDYYTKIYRNSHEKTKAELNYIGAKMKEVRQRGGRNDLWLVDSNFGMYNQDIETCKAIAECQEKYGWPEYIQCDTGKNNKPKVLNAAKLVKGAIRLSGSVQSLDSDVLINIKRNNISADDLMQLAVEADAIDADSRSEVILALPGETLQSHFRTLQIVIDAGFNHANTYQLMMLPGTELSSPETRRKYNMKTRYRVLPRCFGYYNILNKQIIAAEIEEICVSTDTLSFDDYLKCRKLHLMIHIFHTDGLFSSTLKFLKFLNISPFKWLEILMKSELDSLTELFTQYEKESRDELWISRNDIENYIHNPGVIERYISGELGYNLLFIHKSIALGKNVTGLKKLAIDTLQKLLILEHKDSLENMIFLNDVVNFDTCKIKNIFEKINDIPNENFSYDVLQFQNDKQPKDIRKYLMIEPSKFFFILDSTRKDVIVRALSLYGDSQIGIGRILTKVFVKKILRQPIPEHSINNIQNK